MKKTTIWFTAILVGGLTWSNAHGFGFGNRGELDRINHRIHGRVVDHTHNHGVDRRIWSKALQSCRDMYVYLPPQFDPQKSYPVILHLHGMAQDEQFALRHLVEHFDRAIVCGQLPPVIIACPDGSIRGFPTFLNSASFFLNSRAGNFEDYLLQDVWSFLVENYPIRPEPEAHVLAGVSMGGTAAYRLAIANQDRFKVVVGFFPGLNLRWVNCHGCYRSKFDPECWGWRTDYRPNEVTARFGIIPVRFKRMSDPLFHRDEVIEGLSRANPYEMMEKHDLKEGQLSMYVAYGGRDQFNIDAQVESFLYRAKERGLTMTVGYDPHGRHDFQTALRFFPDILAWLRPQLAPFSPPLETQDVAPSAEPRQVGARIRRLFGR